MGEHDHDQDDVAEPARPVCSEQPSRIRLCRTRPLCCTPCCTVRGMSKSVTIRVPEELHAQLQERAETEGTTVTALITEAARNAVRDPRLEDAAEVFRQFVADNADAFDAAFPDDAPAHLDAAGDQGRAA